MMTLAHYSLIIALARAPASKIQPFHFTLIFWAILFGYVFYNDVNCRECELITCDDRICLYFSPSDVYDQALKMLFPKIN